MIITSITLAIISGAVLVMAGAMAVQAEAAHTGFEKSLPHKIYDAILTGSLLGDDLYGAAICESDLEGAEGYWLRDDTGAAFVKCDSALGGFRIVPVPVSTITDDIDPLAELEWSNDVVVTDIAGHVYAIVAAGNDDGMQIIDITDPHSPIPTSAVSDGPDLELDGARDVAVTRLKGDVYALVASYYDDGVQIIDITDPQQPVAVSSLADGMGGFEALDGAAGVAVTDIAGNTYAVVASWDDGGMQIADITDPYTPIPVSAVFDGTGGFEALDGARDVAITEIGKSTYAVIASGNDGGVQIADITDPYAPMSVSAVFDDAGGFSELAGATGVAITNMGSRTYAVVAAALDDGVQIMDITNPQHPVAVSSLIDDTGGFEVLSGAENVAVTSLDGRTYAMIAASGDDGIQIMDITNPQHPVAVSLLADNADGFTTLEGAFAVAITDIAGDTYAVIASTRDDGIQIMRLDIIHSDDAEPLPIEGDFTIVPVPVSAVFDGYGGFSALGGANDVDVYTSKGSIYAVVTGRTDDGIQIMDITDPAHPIPVSAVFDGYGGFSALDVADNVVVYTGGGYTYAISTGYGDNGIQIMDITDPAHPIPVSAVFDGYGGFSALGGADHVDVYTSGGYTYAVVAAYDDGGIQIMDITDPAHPIPVSAVFDGYGGFHALSGVEDVVLYTSGGYTYAVVAANDDDGIQIMDITDPAHPASISTVLDGYGGFSALGGAVNVEVYTSGGYTYAVVAAQNDNGIQIMDITDPAHPIPVSAVFDGYGGFNSLSGAFHVEVYESGGRMYAIVAAIGDNGIQIMDITDPAHPIPVSAVFDGYGGFTALGETYHMEEYESGGRTYAVVAAYGDNGVQIIRFDMVLSEDVVSPPVSGQPGDKFKLLYSPDIPNTTAVMEDYGGVMDCGNLPIIINGITVASSGDVVLASFSKLYVTILDGSDSVPDVSFGFKENEWTLIYESDTANILPLLVDGYDIRIHGATPTETLIVAIDYESLFGVECTINDS